MEHRGCQRLFCAKTGILWRIYELGAWISRWMREIHASLGMAFQVRELEKQRGESAGLAGL